MRKSFWMPFFSLSNLFVARPNHSCDVTRFHFDKVDNFNCFESVIERTLLVVSSKQKRPQKYLWRTFTIFLKLSVKNSINWKPYFWGKWKKKEGGSKSLKKGNSKLTRIQIDFDFVTYFDTNRDNYYWVNFWPLLNRAMFLRQMG